MSEQTNEKATAAEQLLETAEKKVISRRAMMRAAWALPVIAAVPLLNTASAMSGYNCDRNLQRFLDALQSGDRKGAAAIRAELQANGCRC
ncbi:MAG: hypothetical protein SH809_19650 [Rhodothermales bacterium]|nr:hypothetical protein [Rhodothermales bacterium]